MSCSSAAYSSHSRSRSVEPVHGARLIEQRQRQPRHLRGVLGPVVAALGELDDAAAPHVRVAVDLRDLLPVPRDVVEDQPFAQRQIAQRDLVRRRAAGRIVSSRIAPATARSRASRIEAGNAQPLVRGSSGVSCLRSRCSCLADDATVAQRARRPSSPLAGGDHARRGSESCQTCR